ncbi:SPOSA6832_03350, partial [Sporobolomyces salmonicolor]
MPPHSPFPAVVTTPHDLYRQKRDFQRPTVLSRYSILGFLSSGTYGRVYKARIRPLSSDASPAGLLGTPSAATPGKRLKLAREDGEEEGELVAIKKFKPDKDGEVVTYTGISQSACREIMINREISHEHVTALKEVMLEEKSIYLVFEYAEHDFLQIIHHHSSTRTHVPLGVLKSLLWQLVNGVSYLHDNWIIHRDLKPANILVNEKGQVKIGDLGLARLYQEPLQSLYTSDKVHFFLASPLLLPPGLTSSALPQIVVTVWYRSPELLLGARHYTPAIDLWSIGCIYGELLGLRPMFKGEEAKIELGTKKGGVPFQRDQLSRVVEVLGSIDPKQWPSVTQLPEYPQLTRLDRSVPRLASFPLFPALAVLPAHLIDVPFPSNSYPDTLSQWFNARLPRGAPPSLAFDLMRQLLIYDPAKRVTARAALCHEWWAQEPRPHANAFTHLPPPVSYPLRRVSHDDADPKMQHNTLGKYATGYASTSGAASLGLGGAAAAGSGRKRRLE